MKELNKIAQMVGNTYLYKKENYTIKGFIPEEQTVRILTDKQDIVLLADGLHHTLTLFLEVEQEETGLVSSEQHQVRTTIKDLHAILMENINQVRGNKEYVQQAGVVNKSVTNITNLIKAEMEFMKMKQGK
jgi:hypothetical protein